MAEAVLNHNKHLTSGRLLARNTIWSLVGNGAPLLVAVVCIPILIRALGKDRFGVLTLAWALIGYANLFDLGLGRALTQLVSQKLGTERETEIASITWTSLVLMLLLGLGGTGVIVLITPWLVTRGLNVPSSLQHETMQAFLLLGASVPFVITTAGFRGLLEAHQRFGLLTAVRIPMGVFTFAGPLLVLPFSSSLVPVIAALLAGRILSWVAYSLLCLKVLPELRHSAGVVWDRSMVGPLLRFGSWMTVSNIVSPLMVTLDRFLIAALVSMAALAYYATPYEIITKTLIFPGALMGVMFPAFSSALVHDLERSTVLFQQSLKTLFIVLFPISLCAITLAQDALRLWLGAEFASHSFRVLQWLAGGVLINSLALVPFTFLQGAGRPDLTAKLHLIELPLYLALLWWMIHTYGIEGAAISWTCRVTADALVLFVLARCEIPAKGRISLRGFAMMLAAVPVLILGSILQDAIAKSFFLIGAVLTFLLVAWYWILAPNERARIQNYFQLQRLSRFCHRAGA